MKDFTDDSMLIRADTVFRGRLRIPRRIQRDPTCRDIDMHETHLKSTLNYRRTHKAERVRERALPGATGLLQVSAAGVQAFAAWLDIFVQQFLDYREPLSFPTGPQPTHSVWWRKCHAIPSSNTLASTLAVWSTTADSCDS
jgi:hypothetical protein